MFDQHVYRAMVFLQGQGRNELAEDSERQKIDLYLNQYLSFFNQFKNFDSFKVDQALWTFGRFIKSGVVYERLAK